MTNKSEDIIKETKIKEKRLIEYMTQNRYDAIVLGRRDNFRWITGGRCNKVIESNETGFGTIVIKSNGDKFVIGYETDIKRIIEEELQNIDYQPIPLKWYKQTPVDKLIEILKGKRVLADIYVEGTKYGLNEIYGLHYPLLESEILRYKEVAGDVEKIVASIANEITPGMTELGIKARLMQEFTAIDIEVDVLLLGSDERISNYRHPIATDKKIDKYIMISPAVSKWGLHVNIARFIYFGRPDEALLNRFEVVNSIEAAVISECVPGKRFADILELQKRLYQEYGYQHEWEKHFQGGITGYMISDPTKCLDLEACIVNNQTYEWVITLDGVKAAELSFNDGFKQYLFSVNDFWPTKKYEYNNIKFKLPQLLIK